MISKPDCRVSVVVPSYNHSKYITRALESVVAQSYHDYEIICCDDASVDQSVQVINDFIATHNEISCRLIIHETNQGGVITLNDLINSARGEYIALINSDDLWLPEKLAQQVQYLDDNPGVAAVFTQAEIIDGQGHIQTQTVDFPHDIFIQKNRTRGEWLQRLFFELNCLCHPSILIRRSVYQSIGLYDPRFRQLPDMQMWVRLLKQFDIHIIEQPLVQLRFHKTNTSVVNSDTSKRNLNELSYILNDFFQEIPLDVFQDGFKRYFKREDAFSPAELACEMAFVYFKQVNSVKSLYYSVGLGLLFSLLGREDTKNVLAARYKFDYPDFFVMSGTYFYDEHLIAFTKVIEPTSSDGTAFSTWRYLLAFNKRYIGAYLRRFPRLYFPLLKIWTWLRGKK